LSRDVEPIVTKGGRHPFCWRTTRDEEAVDQDGLPVAEPSPLFHEQAHRSAHHQDFPGDFGASLVPVYLVVHDGLSLEHAESQTLIFLRISPMRLSMATFQFTVGHYENET
jgi:hypothetical protein